MANDETIDPDQIEPEDACPVCGERRIDCLVWADDEIVRCTTCGTEYDPLQDWNWKEGRSDG